MVVDVASRSFISFTLPAVAVLASTTTTPELTTYAAGCAGLSKFTATV